MNIWKRHPSDADESVSETRIRLTQLIEKTRDGIPSQVDLRIIKKNLEIEKLDIQYGKKALGDYMNELARLEALIAKDNPDERQWKLLLSTFLFIGISKETQKAILFRQTTNRKPGNAVFNSLFILFGYILDWLFPTKHRKTDPNRRK